MAPNLHHRHVELCQGCTGLAREVDDSDVFYLYRCRVANDWFHEKARFEENGIPASCPRFLEHVILGQDSEAEKDNT